MTSQRKPRGRPKGSEVNDDAALSAIADMLTANSRLKPTTAMRRYKPRIGDAEIRRLQSKWRQRGERYLAEAQMRSAAKHQEQRQQRVATWDSVDFAITPELARQLQIIDETSVIGFTREMKNNRAMRFVDDAENSPTMRRIREIQNSPAMRIIQELENSRAMKIIREHQRIQNMLKGGFG